MTKSIKLKECIITPVDDNGESPNWVQLFAVEEPDHSYLWVVGMEDDRRFSLQYDIEEPNAINEASHAYDAKLAYIRMIAHNNQ